MAPTAFAAFAAVAASRAVTIGAAGAVQMEGPTMQGGLCSIRVVGPTAGALQGLGCVVDPTAADGVPPAHAPTEHEDGDENLGINPPPKAATRPPEAGAAVGSQKSSADTPGATSNGAVPTATCCSSTPASCASCSARI